MKSFKYCFTINENKYIILKDTSSNQFLLRKLYNSTKSDVLTAFKKVVSTASGEKRYRFIPFRPFVNFLEPEDQAAVEDAAEYLSERFGS